MPKFYPPSQLPPMKTATPESDLSSVEPLSHKRFILCLLGFALLGVASAVGGFYLSGKPVWFAAFPSFLAIGWYIAANPNKTALPPNRENRGGGNVMW